MCDMMGSDDRSRRPAAEDQGWSSTGRILGGQMVERSGDIMCGLHCAQVDEECGFSSLGLKTSNYSLVIWASKSP
jgi:hypothetical protein